MTPATGDRVAVASLAGEVDAANAAEVAADLRGLLTNRTLGLVVDLTGTSYLDSAGIKVLFALGDELRSRQQTMRLVVDHATPVARMIAITSLDRAFPAHATVRDAVAATERLAGQ
jgi:anti-anti-sigma factor